MQIPPNSTEIPASSVREQLTKESVIASLEERDFKTVRRWFRDGEEADIAEIFETTELARSVVLFRLLAKDRRASVFSYLPF